jgi:hypothetical protein
LIMESLDSSLSVEQVCQVNRCRVYLQVLWWSEITDERGEAISDNAINGRREPYVHNKWKWPIQERPNAQDWEVWMLAISMGQFKSRRGRIELQRPLGCWQDGNYVWYYDPACDRLLHSPSDTVWTRVAGRPTRLARLKFCRSNIVDDNFPRSCVATIIRTGSSTVYVDGFAQVQKSDQVVASSFIDFLRANKKWNWIQNVRAEDDDVIRIATDIQENGGIVVSDGSFKEERGSAALVIEGKNSTSRILADVVVPGDSSHQCAFRSEAAGILASFQLVNAVVQFTGITTGTIKMCCDGESALSRCFSKKHGSKHATLGHH